MLLPEQHTDSVFFLFVEEFGTAGVYVLLGLATLLLWGSVYWGVRFFLKKRVSTRKREVN